MEIGGRETASAQYVKDEDGRLLQEAGLFRVRWVRLFDTLLQREVGQTSNRSCYCRWPQTREITPATLEAELKTTETADAVRTMANGKSVRPDQLLAELLKLRPRESSTILAELYRNIVEIWRGGEVP